MMPLNSEGDDRVIASAFRWTTIVLLIGLFSLYLGMRTPSTPDVKLIQQAQIPTYPPRTTPSSRPNRPHIPFKDVTLESGLAFRHDQGLTHQWRLPETMGGGCLVFDYDLDGDQDLLLIHSTVRAEGSSIILYANDGTGQFLDVTRPAGLSFGLVGMGASSADFDNDGWPDLLLTAVGTNRLFHNRDGTFVEITAGSKTGGDEKTWSMGSCWIDYDQDGDLDLFVCNYLEWSADLDQALNCCWNGVDRSYCDPDLFAGVQPYFYENQGDGTFEEIGDRVGIAVVNRDTGQPVPKALAVSVCDLNHDGWPDLAVTGDGGQNLLYLNQQSGRFQEMATELGFAFDRYGQAARSFGIDMALVESGQSLILGIGRSGNVANSLYIRSGTDAVFTDRSLSAAFATPSRPFLTFGICFLDVDLDGRLDIVTTNGQIQTNFDLLQKSQSWQQTPQLYWQSQADPMEFVNLSIDDCGQDFMKPMPGRGVVYSDFDLDGDLDLLFTAVGDRPRLLRNDQQQNSHWLRLNLHARTANRDGLQTRVEATVNSTTLVRCVHPVGGYLSQHELPLTFGLGHASSVERLVIHWPDGTDQEFMDLVPNQRLDVVQSIHPSN